MRPPDGATDDQWSKLVAREGGTPKERVELARSRDARHPSTPPFRSRRRRIAALALALGLGRA